MNLLPRSQRRGVGSKLLDVWLGNAARAGAHDIHVGVNRANSGATLFWASHRFKVLPGVFEGRTLWMGRACTPGGQ